MALQALALCNNNKKKRRGTQGQQGRGSFRLAGPQAAKGANIVPDRRRQSTDADIPLRVAAPGDDSDTAPGRPGPAMPRHFHPSGHKAGARGSQENLADLSATGVPAQGELTPIRQRRGLTPGFFSSAQCQVSDMLKFSG